MNLQLAEQMTWEKMEAADAFAWALGQRILLDGRPFTLENHEYQREMLHEDHPDQAFKKGAQLGLTSVHALKTIHGLIYGGYPQGCLYLFPTRDDVTDFSKGRFQPLIDDNPVIASQIRDTDAANIKRVGSSMLYFRGARKTRSIGGLKATSSQLKSIPVDRIVFDEIDEMEPAMVQLALERISHSLIKQTIYIATPTIPDYGIDARYQKSDQRIWLIKCEKCRKETCLELEFPDCLQRQTDGTVTRICTKCGAEIHPRGGRWVAQYPEVAKERIGWWISQLNSIYINPKSILDLYEDPPDGNISEVYNSKLGMAHIAAENRLTESDVYACCGYDAMQSKHSGPCGMGVDVGNLLHVVVGYRPDDVRTELVYMARVSDFSDVHDIAKRFNVHSAVIDREPEVRKAREFQEAEEYRIWLCDYQDEQKGAYNWSDDRGLVVVNRTEICDQTHSLVTTPGKLTIPRRSPEIDEYAKEMSNIAKVLEEDPETGKRVYRYRKLGVDHYRHATNYCKLALDRVPMVRLPDADQPEYADTDYQMFGR